MKRDEFTRRVRVDVVRFYEDDMGLRLDGEPADPMWVIQATVEDRGMMFLDRGCVLASEVALAWESGVDALSIAEAQCAANVLKASGPGRKA